MIGFDLIRRDSDELVGQAVVLASGRCVVEDLRDVEPELAVFPDFEAALASLLEAEPDATLVPVLGRSAPRGSDDASQAPAPAPSEKLLELLDTTAEDFLDRGGLVGLDLRNYGPQTTLELVDLVGDTAATSLLRRWLLDEDRIPVRNRLEALIADRVEGGTRRVTHVELVNELGSKVADVEIEDASEWPEIVVWHGEEWARAFQLVNVAKTGDPTRYTEVFASSVLRVLEEGS